MSGGMTVHMHFHDNDFTFTRKQGFTESRRMVEISNGVETLVLYIDDDVAEALAKVLTSKDDVEATQGRPPLPKREVKREVKHDFPHDFPREVVRKPERWSKVKPTLPTPQPFD